VILRTFRSVPHYLIATEHLLGRTKERRRVPGRV
jgi:hypothetical protein